MIPQNAITAWRNIAPWASSDQVEYDKTAVDSYFIAVLKYLLHRPKLFAKL